MNAFQTRQYRNLFQESGKSSREIEIRLEEIWNTFFYGSEEERIYHPVGEDMGYLEDTGNHDARTEGMSYGMMICVQMNKKEEFDRIWKWACTYMWMTEGESEGYFAWSCGLDGKKNADGAAPDGEEFFAMALFFASHRWGTEKESFVIRNRQRKYCAPACIRERKADPVSPCGTGTTNRFYLCRELILRILPTICLIFMNCLLSGQTRRTDLSGRKLRQSADVI